MNLHIGNLGPFMDNTTLDEAFSPYGGVLSVEVIADDDGQCTGYGFVEFLTADEAHAAMEALNGACLEGRRITVVVANQRDATRHNEKSSPGRGWTTRRPATACLGRGCS